MPYFRKLEKPDGTFDYVEVPDAEIEVPAEHPLSKKLAETTAESIARRKKLAELRQAADETPATPDPVEPKQPASPAPTIDLEAVTAQVAQRVRAELTAEQIAASAAAQKREDAIAAALTSNGLDEKTYRPILEANPDLNAIAQQAKALGAAKLRFDPTPAGGNGQPADNSWLDNVTKKLKLKTDE